MNFQLTNILILISLSLFSNYISNDTTDPEFDVLNRVETNISNAPEISNMRAEVYVGEEEIEANIDHIRFVTFSNERTLLQSDDSDLEDICALAKSIPYGHIVVTSPETIIGRKRGLIIKNDLINLGVPENKIQLEFREALFQETDNIHKLHIEL